MAKSRTGLEAQGWADQEKNLAVMSSLHGR